MKDGDTPGGMQAFPWDDPRLSPDAMHPVAACRRQARSGACRYADSWPTFHTSLAELQENYTSVPRMGGYPPAKLPSECLFNGLAQFVTLTACPQRASCIHWAFSLKQQTVLHFRCHSEPLPIRMGAREESLCWLSSCLASLAAKRFFASGYAQNDSNRG